MTNKTTVYLDPRGPAQEEAEQIKKQLEEAEQQETNEKVMTVINGLLSYTIILPLLFMFAFNYSLTKMFDFDRIGYIESLGVVIVARVLRGAKK